MNQVRTLKIALMAAALATANIWPGMAEANGDGAHVGAIHIDPLVGIGIGFFVGLITLLFVGQWMRANSRRQTDEAPLASRETDSFDLEEAQDELERGREDRL